MGPVRRILTFGLVWLAAAVVATVVAWQGVGLIDDQVTGDRPLTLTAAEVDAALADATTGTTTASPPARSTSRDRDDGPRCHRVDLGPEETHTYRLTGGTTTLRFTPAGVTMVSATPEQGYQVRSGRGDGNGWRVEFEERPAAAGSTPGGTAGPAPGSTTTPTADTTTTATAVTATTAAATAARTTAARRRTDA